MKHYINNHTKLKKALYMLMMSNTECRPRLWMRLLRPFYTKCAWSSKIYHSTRMDITPFHAFTLGKQSVVESYACINNAMGDVTIGNDSRIGLHSTVIGPVKIGDNVIIAQGVVLSGLNHSFTNTAIPISKQKVSTAPINVTNDVWIGANAVITAGVNIGSHSVVAAGSVVTHNVPPHCVVAGVPARIIKTL